MPRAFISAFTGLALAGAVHGATINHSAILRAIREVESGDNDSAVGVNTERGAYQFSSITWRMYTSAPFLRAHNRRMATLVAERHLRWILRELDKAGYKGTPEQVAIFWNHGHLPVVLSRSKGDYPERVANLYREYARTP